MLGKFVKSRLGKTTVRKTPRFQFSEEPRSADAKLEFKETLDDANWLEKFKLKEYSKFKAKKLSPAEFQNYFDVLRRISAVKLDQDTTQNSQVLFEVDGGTALVSLFRIWLALMLPATILSLQLLYFMNMDAPAPDRPEESDSPVDQIKQHSKGKFHEFEDADQSIRLGKWLDQFRFLGISGEANEQEIRGVYHFLDQCKTKLGYDYIQVGS